MLRPYLGALVLLGIRRCLVFEKWCLVLVPEHVSQKVKSTEVTLSALARSYEPLLVEFLGFRRKLISNLGRRIGWRPYGVIPPAAKLIITCVI